MICSVVLRRDSRQACPAGDRHHGERRALPSGAGPAGPIHHQHVWTAPETVPSINDAVVFAGSHRCPTDFVDVIPGRWSVLLSRESFGNEGLHKRKVHLISQGCRDTSCDVDAVLNRALHVLHHGLLIRSPLAADMGHWHIQWIAALREAHLIPCI